MSSCQPFALNDRIGHRGRKHTNLIVAGKGDEQVILEFQGRTIPGVVTVIRDDYTKQGRWSHTTWMVVTASGVRVLTLCQDWETGCWLNSRRWAECLAEFQDRARPADNEGDAPRLEPASIERFIRATLPDLTQQLDTEAENARKAEPAAILAELRAAQEEAAAATAALAQIRREVEGLAEAEDLRQQAAATQARVAAARAAMARGASLADLKALL